ncbi:MAG: hypothetical protein M1305_05390, partial [Candidatus Marsarchaeota archaeon]|nr:hypothetical protein [Candidatus Marsarchaeota archaeon]
CLTAQRQGITSIALALKQALASGVADLHPAFGRKTDLEPVDEVHASVDLDNELEALARRGFLVFTAVEEQIIEGGVGPSSPFPFLHVAVVRDSDSSIDWATKGTPEGVAPSGESCGQKRRAG